MGQIIRKGISYSGGGSGSTVAVSADYTEGTELATVSIDGADTKIYTPEVTSVKLSTEGHTQESMKFGIEDGKYGYYVESEGADTFYPFKSGGGSGGLNPLKCTTTAFNSSAVRVRADGLEPSGNYGFGTSNMLNADGTMSSTYFNPQWNSYTTWEVGMRIKPLNTYNGTRVLCGCAYSGSYYYGPSIELYGSNNIGVGYTHTPNTWTIWFNTPADVIKVGIWNIITLSWDASTSIFNIHVEREDGYIYDKDITEQQFAASNLPWTFGQIAANGNYARNIIFDNNNCYLIGNNKIVLGTYLNNNNMNYS